MVRYDKTCPCHSDVCIACVAVFLIKVLKGRLKLYEKSAKRRVNYKGSFETGTSKVELYPDRFFFSVT